MMKTTENEKKKKKKEQEDHLQQNLLCCSAKAYVKRQPKAEKRLCFEIVPRSTGYQVLSNDLGHIASRLVPCMAPTAPSDGGLWHHS